MNAPSKNQKGQAFMGYALVIFAIMGSVYALYKNYGRIRAGGSYSHYRELALAHAKGGFDYAFAYFRRNIADYSSLQSFTITSQLVHPWPDDAFKPGPSDTDHYNLISVTAHDGNPVAGGIIRTVPLHLTGPAEATSSNLWARYVIVRQNVRNFSANANTASVKTTPEAVHSLHGSRDPGGMVGAGTVWGITVKSYVFSWPGDLTDTALHEGGSLLNKPLGKVPDNYPNTALRGKKILWASAKIYGEVSGMQVNPMSFEVPLQVNAGSNITISGTKALVDGTLASTGKAYARAYGNATFASVINGGVLLPTTNQYTNWPQAGGSPALSNVFPGFSITQLSQSADKSGDIMMFPDHNVSPGTNAYEMYKRDVSTMTFYFLNGNSVFPTSETRRMLGVGLVFVNGNLTIQNGNASDWAGIVYVNGNVTMNSGSISGILIATGTVNITGGTVLNTRVTSNKEVAQSVRDYLFTFRVSKPPVIVN